MNESASLEPSIEHRERVDRTIPHINANCLCKSISFTWDAAHQQDFTNDYKLAFACKLSAQPYFQDFAQLYNELRYSLVRATCLLELSKEDGLTPQSKQSLEHQLKYYSENAIYRFYTYWELTSRFLNAYFNLDLQFSKKAGDRERFFYANEVLPLVEKRYKHPFLTRLSELWRASEDILRYRKVKTHRENPTLKGMPGTRVVKEKLKEHSKFTLRSSDPVDPDWLIDMCSRCYYCAKEGMELCSHLFDVGHDEIGRTDENRH